LKETEQRAAEMAVINSIQQGIAAELNFQAIVDLVGDKLREVLKTDDIGIRLARRADEHAASPVLLRARPATRHSADRPSPAGLRNDDAGRESRGPQHVAEHLPRARRGSRH
jgi:hypothetical protein